MRRPINLCASTDGEPAPLETVAGVLRGVELEPGLHTVAFTFRPWTVYLGLAGCIFGLALLAGID